MTVQKVRAAIGDRATYLAMLYRSFAGALPAARAEELAREAVFECGRLKGERDGQPLTPEDWVDSHAAKGSASVFESRIVKGTDSCEVQMTYCPLLERWKELGYNDAELDLLCDIAMEVDRGRGDFHGLEVDIPQRMGKGDEFCRLVIRSEK